MRKVKEKVGRDNDGFLWHPHVMDKEESKGVLYYIKLGGYDLKADTSILARREDLGKNEKGKGFFASSPLGAFFFSYRNYLILA